MKRETIIPLNEADWLRMRCFDLTSTDISALFGCSPYCTAFELWHIKKSGEQRNFEPTQRMKWGTRLQDAIAAGIAEEREWRIRRMSEYIRIPELRIGASFDFKIEGTTDGVEAEATETGHLEIKNVDSLQYKQGWIVGEDGKVEAPLHIEFQVQHQLAVSGLAYAYIGVLVGGNDLKLLRRERNERIISAIKVKAVKFWKSIEDNNPPEPDFGKDASFIADLYNFAEPGKVIDVTGNEEIEAILAGYKAVTEDAKLATDKKEALKAELLTKIGTAEKVIFAGGSISAGLVGPAMVEAYERKGYRTFRVNFKKEAK